jgi:predicted phage terminase large subunit-like protein
VSVGDHLEAAPVNNDQPLITTERLDAMTEAIAAVARDSFAAFRRTIRPGMLWSPFVGRLTRELQKFHTAFVAGKRPKLALLTPPQHGKSIVAEDFSAWVAGKHPDWKTIYASYSDDLGVLRNMNLQRLFTSQRYRHIFPNLTIGGTGYQCNASLIEYAGGPGSFRNTTVNGPITGMEQHLGVLDDFVKGRAEANSKLQRDRTWNWFTDDFSSRFSKDSALLVICTRWHVDDLIGRLMLKYPEMRVISFQAIAEKDEPFRLKGQALFPALKPLGMLLDQNRLMSESSWQAEYQQRPYVVGGGIFPIEKLQVIPIFDRREIASTVLAVDKAGTQGGDGAYTAIVIMHKMKNGTFLIERVVRGRWGALEREKNIKHWADATKENLKGRTVRFTVVIEVEPGSGGKESAESTIRNLAGHVCIGDKPGAGRSKELRAEPFAAQVQGGNVYLLAGPWVQDFLDEAESFPNSRYLDQVDAAAMAFHHLATERGYSLEIYKRVNA